MNVKIYTTPTCGYCHQAKRFFADRGVKYTEYDVSRNQEAASEMMSLTGQMGVPVIVIDGQVVVGFNRPRIEQLLAGRDNGRHISFGLSIADADKVAGRSGSTAASGAFVGKVAPSAPGEEAGLKPGDIIIKMNFHSIRNANDLENVISSLSTGEKVTISYIRGQKTLQSQIVL